MNKEICFPFSLSSDLFDWAKTVPTSISQCLNGKTVCNVASHLKLYEGYMKMMKRRMRMVTRMRMRTRIEDAANGLTGTI